MNNNKFPDRTYFWGIIFTVEPIWASEYHAKVMKTRMMIEPANLNKAVTIVVSENWMKKL